MLANIGLDADVTRVKENDPKLKKSGFVERIVLKYDYTNPLSKKLQPEIDIVWPGKQKLH